MIDFTPGKIIWRADKISEQNLRRVIDSGVLPEGTFVELGRLFLDWHSKDFIDYCQRRGYPVICNAQILGTPEQCLLMTEAYLQYRPHILSIVASACNTGEMKAADAADVDVLKKFADRCKKAGTQSMAVTMPAPKSWGLARWEFRDSAATQAMRYIDIAHRAGIGNVLCDTGTIARVEQGSIYRCLYLNAADVVPTSDPDVKHCCEAVARAIECGADRVVIGDAMTTGNGPIDETVAKNYAIIKKAVVAAIEKVNAFHNGV